MSCGRFFGLCLFSTSVFAVNLGEKLFDDLLGSRSIHLVSGLEKSILQLSVDVLSDGNYRRLVQELHLVAEEIPQKQPLSKDDFNKVQGRVDVLSARISMLSDPVKSGRCASLGLDHATAANSRGDWSMVKKRDGAEIKPSSHGHYDLYRFFLFGCNGRPDFEVARKVIFDVSKYAPGDLSVKYDLRPYIRHCVAERWAKYGIGGASDEKLAAEFSRRYARDFFFYNGDTPEERKKKAREYPEDAANGFKCPAGNDRSRIDPRDPWKDLW